MKKVLIITSHFAPDAHVGAKRPTKFCKFLSELGWQPIVVTETTGAYHRLDEKLTEDLPDNIRIVRLKPWRFLNRLDYTIFTINFSWLLPAFFAAWRIVKQQKVKVIMSTAPPSSSHVVAFLLKIITGKKWVCEYRDPWIFSYQYVPAYRIIRWADRWLTRWILHKADHLITTSHTLGAHFVSLSPPCLERSSVIYNGHDSDDFPSPDVNVSREADKDTIVFTYLGTWGNIRTPEHFLKGLKKFLRDYNGRQKPKIKVNFIGEVKFDLRLETEMMRMIENEGLDDIVFIHPFLSYKEGLIQLYKSDVLLLVEAPRAAQAGQLSAKLFEYLYTRVPILALVPPNSEHATIIQNAGAGEVVLPDDISKIKEAIQKAYEAFQDGKLQVKPNLDLIAKYNRRSQTKSLVDIFNNAQDNTSKLKKCCHHLVS